MESEDPSWKSPVSTTESKGVTLKEGLLMPKKKLGEISSNLLTPYNIFKRKGGGQIKNKKNWASGKRKWLVSDTLQERAQNLHKLWKQ